MERLDHEVFQDAGFHHGQGQFATETNPGGRRFDATLEEVLHLITHEGYANTYPETFGEKPGTELAECLDRARGGHSGVCPAATRPCRGLPMMTAAVTTAASARNIYTGQSPQSLEHRTHLIAGRKYPMNGGSSTGHWYKKRPRESTS